MMSGHEVLIQPTTPTESLLQQHPSLDVYGSTFIDLALDFQGQQPEAAEQYMSVYERLAMQAGNTSWLFPEDEREAARQATIGLFGSTLQTVYDHYAAGEKTESFISLKGRNPTRMELDGSEPLMLLEALAETYWITGQVMGPSASPSIRSVPVERGIGYSTYRFVDVSEDPLIPPCASLYIRPQASDVFNEQREYGGVAGVEASIALRVDVRLLHDHLAGLGSKMIGLNSTSSANKGVVCLRIDRSGVEVELGDGTVRRLPTTPDGSAAHDIGSVTREDVGRLLAANNPGDLNHLPIAPNLGSAEQFSVHAQLVGDTVTEHRITKPKLASALRKQRAVTPQTSGFPYFELGQQPYDIPAVREMAEHLGTHLGVVSTDREIQALFALMGSQKAFQYNIARLRGASSGLGHNALVSLIEQTGIMQPMPLRTVEGMLAKRPEGVDYGVILEGVVPWILKRINSMKAERLHVETAVLGATERKLDTPTERMHPDVVVLRRQLGRTPTAVDFMRGPATDYLQAIGVAAIEVVDLPYSQIQNDGKAHITSGAEVAQAVVEAHPRMRDSTIFHPQNAPAGSMFYNLLDACIDTFPDFDLGQFYISHGRTYLARTYHDNITTRLFQNTYSAPSSLVRWIYTLHQLNQRFGAATSK